MNPSGHDDLSNLSLLDLFRVEAEGQTAALTAGLLELERGASAAGRLRPGVGEPAQGAAQPQPDTAHWAAVLESLMRAAHSLKGAARIVNLGVAVRVAHALEDCFVAAQQGRLRIGQSQIDTLLRGVDLLLQISKCSESGLAAWEQAHAEVVADFVEMTRALGQVADPVRDGGPQVSAGPAANPTAAVAAGVTPPPVDRVEGAERVVRLNAENLNRLLALAGESLVETRWLRPFSEAMQRVKRMQSELEVSLSGLRRQLEPGALSDGAAARMDEVVELAGATRELLAARLEDLEVYDRRSAHLSNRLYLEVLRTRMRPFAEGTQRFPRMVRDLAHSLGKQVRLEILGEHTQVDRDILEKLETPLAHLLRNAVDHGCETPEERQAAGKEAEAVIVLEARHSAGMLLVTVADDGRGVDPQRVREVVVARQFTSAPVAQRLGEGELLEFLFLPGFSLKSTVTELSGRGVGLDVVQNVVKALRGTVRVAAQPGRGMKFQLQLPLTLSVVRTLLVAVAGEPYALPLGQIARAVKVPRERIELLEGRPHFAFGDQRVGLLSAQWVLGLPPAKPGDGGWRMVDGRKPRSSNLHVPSSVLSVVVLGERQGRYGLVVDGFLGERELVVQPLDGRLGKVQDISAAALMEDGSPVLILDVDDLLCSIEQLLAGGVRGGELELGLGEGAGALELPGVAPRRKRVLAVDDSLTVRELVRKLLLSRGYLVDVAVDGRDGWNLLKAGLGGLRGAGGEAAAVDGGVYDLVITDVDMPRMDGIELARLIKGDAQLKSLPVLVVSYKDREEDRLRGLEAGADYYLAKGSFHDETLVQAVLDLIGEAEG